MRSSVTPGLAKWRERGAATCLAGGHQANETPADRDDAEGAASHQPGKACDDWVRLGLGSLRTSAWTGTTVEATVLKIRVIVNNRHRIFCRETVCKLLMVMAPWEPAAVPWPWAAAKVLAVQ